MIIIIVEVLIIEVCFLNIFVKDESNLLNVKVIVVVEITGIIIIILVEVVIIVGITVEVVVVFVVSFARDKFKTIIFLGRGSGDRGSGSYRGNSFRGGYRGTGDSSY
jgi:uncharacterized membrane protein YgcG